MQCSKCSDLQATPAKIRASFCMDQTCAPRAPLSLVTVTRRGLLCQCGSWRASAGNLMFPVGGARIGSDRINLRCVAGSGIHCTRKRRGSVACRGGFDCGGVFCRQDTWPQYLVLDRCRNLCGSLGRYRWILDRQEVRISAVEQIRDSFRIDRRTPKNRSMAVRAVRREIRFHCAFFAVPTQHGCRACRYEFDGAT
jgi:hypothetical protein